eukprot:TRINITY_DN4996_c0_g1_i3.p1 TRINITY_DN4996_c0_g1~~TRINITY_DN4996_c0_g1_i3.p1  ORF type:complete len:1051 (+),score=334.33 TRINITY_DN4996_c0_g1_i3:104-3154(+)
MLALAAAAAGAEGPQRPLRLRADGSDTHPLRRTPHTDFPAASLRPGFEWAPQHGARGRAQAAYEISVTDSATGRTLWESGEVASPEPRARYPSAAPLPAGGREYDWVVRWRDDRGDLSPWSAPARFRAPLRDEQWDGVDWIGSDSVNLHRAEFDAPAALKSVALHICGLGYSSALVNGAPASSAVLTTSAWTNNERQNAYSSYDVTALVKAGAKNAVGVALGAGWRDTKSFPRRDSGDSSGDGTRRVLRAQVVAVLADGSTAVLLKTGSSWASAAGPVTEDSVYNGEHYDARKEQAGWAAPGFDASTWGAATVVTDGPRGAMVPWSAPPIAVSRVVQPVKIWKVAAAADTFTVDFGSNMAGVCRLKDLKLQSGAAVTLRHGEILQHKGLPGLLLPDPQRVYQANLRSAQATDVYTAKGDPAGESYTPTMTYHGFRYVEVSGLANLTAANIEMLHFHSAVEQRTNATFSSPTLQRMMKMALGAQRSNMMAVPTDCDQRDERLGWMGDASLSSDAIALSYDASAFLRDFMRNMASEQGGDGSLPDVVPYVRYGGRPGDESWSTAFVQIPYVLWKVYGDTEVVKEHWDEIVRQVELSASKAAQGIDKLTTSYGQGAKPSTHFTEAFSYLMSVRQLGEMAKALGNTTAAQRAADLAAKGAQAFNAMWYDSGAYDPKSQGQQTAQVLPLALGIAPNSSTVLGALQDRLKAKGNHWYTGIIGFKFLFDVLREGGYASEALALLQLTDYPSIGYMFANPDEDASENLWELPDANREGTGMNSRNHHMWSSYSHYLVAQVAGVTQAAGSAGHKRVELRPMNGGALDVSAASAEIDTPRGRLVHSWRRSGGAQCAKVAEGDVARLSCGAKGGVISEVRFASFGAPAGGPCRSADGFQRHPRCHSGLTEARVRQLCLGRSECAVPASPSDLSVPDGACAAGDPLRLWVDVQCSAPPSLQVDAEVPVSATAELLLPHAALGLRSPQLTEAEGAPAGIALRPAYDAGHRVLAATLGSGSWHFNLADKQ